MILPVDRLAIIGEKLELGREKREGRFTFAQPSGEKEKWKSSEIFSRLSL
jgi:hypothetical protein